MSRRESIENESGIELSTREWRFLNLYSEPESPLWKRQLKTIDRLRKKYPPDSPAWHALDVFDPRTGLADRNTEIANIALGAYRAGNMERYQELMSRLTNGSDI